MKIVAVSDIHIRVVSRHREYSLVFKKLLKQLQQQKPDWIFNLGDTFHQKLNLSPENIKLTRWFFEEMGKIAPVVSIIGNHDLNLTNLDRPNSVAAVLEKIPNQIILEKSEYLELAPGIGVGCFSLLDGKESWPKNIPAKYADNINIALYHGAVNTPHNDIGFIIENSIKSDEWFSNYDYVMCGDIHKAEQLDHNGRIWMTGNLIQQNFGEGLEKGFLVWDIKSKDDWSVKKVNIKNEYNFITVLLSSNDEETSKEEIKKVLKKSGVTKHSNVRIKVPVNKYLATTFKETMKQFTINEFSIVPVITDVFKSSDNGSLYMPNAIAQTVNFYNPNVQAQLIKNYVDECIPGDKINLEDVVKINEELNSELGTVKDVNAGNTWVPSILKLDNIFCFGEDIVLDFTKEAQGFVGLFGKNASGKSSLFSALSFAIFGKTLKKTSNNDVIRIGAKEAQSKIIIMKGNTQFRIERTISKIKDNVKNSVKFDQFENGEWISLNEETIPETNKAISKHFGTFEDFIMTSMSTQEDYNAFTNSGNANRKEVIMRHLGHGIWKDLYDLALSKIKRIGDVVDEIDDTEILYTKLHQLRENLDELDENAEEYELILTSSRTQIKDLEKKIEKKKGELKPIAHSPKSVDELEEDLQANEDLLEKAVLVIKQKVETAKEIKSQLQGKKQEQKEELSQLNTQIRKLGQQVAVLTSNIKRLETKKLDQQVDCDREDCALLRLYKEDIDSLEEYKEVLEKDKDSLDSLEKREKELKEQIRLHDEFAELRRKTEDLLEKKKRVEEKIDTIKQDIDVYNSNKSLIEFNDTLTEQINELEKKKREEETQFSRARAQKEVDSRLRTEYEERIEEINSTIDKISAMKKKLDILVQYKDIMNSNALPNVLLNSYVDIFEAEVNRILSSSTDLLVKVDLTQKKGAKTTELEMKYSNAVRNIELMPIELASGAEKMLLSLAIRVALINITAIQKSTILIIDEGFGSLHHEWIPMLKNLFESFKDMFSSIIIVSHLDTIQDLPDKIITTEKEKGLSRLSI